MSTLGPPSRDASTSTNRKGPTRKAPPSPLAISSVSSQSRLQPPSISTDVSPAASSSTPSSTNNAGRNSLESSRSDLTSIRSEITSLRVSEFPLPPSALPTIPASPRTPRSLHFSTTPRSQSPISGFAFQQQQHSPKNQSPAPSERLGAGSPVVASHHGYDLPRESGPAYYSQYAVYKEANIGASGSQPATPTTAGTVTTRDWPTSSENRSSLQPPRPAYAASDMPALRSSSPLRNASFASQQEEPPRRDKSGGSRSNSPAPYSPRVASPQPPRSASPQPPRSTSPQPPRSMSPQPPRSPLPVPPRPRDSTRYSHIARNAGVSDMGLDISEEDLLSTDFISELLNQPAVSSPRSARFLRLPDSPQSASFSNIQSNALRLPDSPQSVSFSNVQSNERMAPGRQASLDSPGFSAPKSVAANGADLSKRHSSDGLEVPLTGMESPRTPSMDGTDWQRRTTRRMQSGLASSVFPSGGDRIDEASPSTPSFSLSPYAENLAVPDNRVRSHASPHPLMPSTPLSPESFTSATSPRSPQAFVQAQAGHSAGTHSRKRSTSQSLAAHLPIGGRPSSSATQGTVSPRIRQHHYPRHGATKGGVTVKGSAQDRTPLQSMTYPPQPANLVQSSATTMADTTQNDSKSEGAPAQFGTAQGNATSPSPSHMSFSSSTRTQRDSVPTSSRTGVTLAVSADSHEGEPIQLNTANTRNSAGSSYESTDHGVDDDDSTNYELEGEIQTASRVWGGASPVGVNANVQRRPTIVGLAPAVILNHNSVENARATSPDKRQSDILRYVDRTPFDSYHTEAIVSVSPHDPTPGHSPPAHRTDMPESVKSLGFTEDNHGAETSDQMHDGQVAYLPYDEVAGYGSPNYLGYRSPSSALQSPNSQLDRTPSNKGATSFKSVVSYITSKSLASNKSTNSGRWGWLKRKPLPPLPPGTPSERDSTYPDTLHRHEAGLQLPDLAQRAGNLQVRLDRGSYARGSKVSSSRPGEPQGWSDRSPAEKAARDWHEDASAGTPPGLTFSRSGGKVEIIGDDSLKMAMRNQNRKRKLLGSPEYGSEGFSTYPNGSQHDGMSPRRLFGRARARKWIWFPVVLVVFVGMILGIALGTSLRHKHATGAKGKTCTGETAGFLCNLDATCTCPSGASQASSCAAPLAQALAQLVPVASQLFATNITTVDMALALWETQGTLVGQDCTSQADLVDVGSVLDNSVLPNRTQWAQSALLWTLFQTGDIPATQKLQSAIEKMPFQLLQKDGPQDDPSNQFVANSSGFIFDFAAQTVDAPSLKFQDDASPPQAQLRELNSIAQSSLDRMYSFASASSTQQQSALSTYWEAELSLDRNDLPKFLTVFKKSPILLPFDVTASPGGQSISDLLVSATNRTLSFPPSIGCFPGLNSSQVQRISTVETKIFGLSALSSSPSTFDSSCFGNRPVYGVLDVLRTRLPFSDFRAGVAKQAALLTTDASSRAVLRVGELLSALPADSDTDLSSFSLDPRQFGTLSHVNHIALSWLKEFPNTTLAADAAKFVLDSPSSPPSSDSPLFNSSSIPTIEAAVFGNIFLSDITAFTSSFSTPSGGLFFGSSEGDIFRRWALQQSSQATITWSATNFAAQAVLEKSTPDTRFEAIWSVATSSISNAPGGVTGPREVAQVLSAFFGT